jgi:hypothetical protein
MSNTEQPQTPVAQSLVQDGYQKPNFTDLLHGPAFPSPIVEAAGASLTEFNQPALIKTAIAKTAATPLSEQRCVVFNKDSSMIEGPKQSGIEYRLSSAQGLVPKTDLSESALFKAPNIALPILGDHRKHVGSMHPSRFGLLAHVSEEASSSLSNNPDSSSTGIDQLSYPTSTNALKDSGSLDAVVALCRKRKASSPPRPENSVSPTQAVKKRVSFGVRTDNVQRSINRTFLPGLQPYIKNECTSLQSPHQPYGNIKKDLTQPSLPRIPTGPEQPFNIKKDFTQHSLPSIPTGPKQLFSIKKDLTQTSFPSIPTGPKQIFRTVGVGHLDLRRLFGCTQDSGIFYRQPPVLIMHQKEQAHAPRTKGTNGIYHTLLNPEPVRLTQFPVLVCTVGGGLYQYVGNYVLKESWVLEDREVEILGQETCCALVTSQIMKVNGSGAEVVRREAFGALIGEGVVRTEKEATKISVCELVRRMKHIKVSVTTLC